jgi:hypothetical protein
MRWIYRRLQDDFLTFPSVGIAFFCARRQQQLRARSGPCLLFVCGGVAGPTSTLPYTVLSRLTVRKNVLAREKNVRSCMYFDLVISLLAFQRTYLIGTLYFKSDTVSARESSFRLLHTYRYSVVFFHHST